MLMRRCVLTVATVREDLRVGDAQGLPAARSNCPAKEWNAGARRPIFMSDGLAPCILFLLAFAVSALAGLGQVLRGNRPLTPRGVFSAGLNSGALGLVVGMLLYTWFKDNTWFLLGLCLLAGLSGMSILNFIMTVVRRGGVDVEININPRLSEPDPESSPTLECEEDSDSKDTEVSE